ERCFVIGLGTGVTAGAPGALGGTRSGGGAEISRGGVGAAPVLRHRKPRAAKKPQNSGRGRGAAPTPHKRRGPADLIVSEPSNPWVTGIEMLYSREFLEASRRRLAPGGVYAQWIHLYEIDGPTVDLVLRTFASVFPDAAVWFAQDTDVVLLGFADVRRALDVHALEETFRRPDFAAAFARAKIEPFAALLAHEVLPLGTLQAAAGAGEIHTLRHPILSDRAARAFFRGEAATLPSAIDPESREIGAANSLLRRYAGVAAREPLPEDVLEPALIESCRLSRTSMCTALAASWLHDYPYSERRPPLDACLRQMESSSPVPLPELARISLLFDTGAAASGDDGIPYRRVAGATNRFRSFYHYAVPFSTDRLEFLWDHCNGNACQEAGRSAARQLGFAYHPVARAARGGPAR